MARAGCSGPRERHDERPGVHDDAPWLLTLDLDPVSTAFFERARAAHFPATRNRVPAHVMLFHRIAAEHGDELVVDLERTLGGVAPFAVAVTGVRSMGTGVAYELASERLSALRARLARLWGAWLVPQDRERYRPHVVVQNKVEARTARETLALVAASFAPFEVTATGIGLWRYRNGPWEAARAFAFAATSGERDGGARAEG